MAVIYKVIVEPAKKKKSFAVTWLDTATKKEESFEAPGAGIIDAQVDWMGQKAKQRVALGEKLFTFLDGNNRCLSRALAEAGKQGDRLRVYLRACPDTADWPFELLFHEGSFMLLDRLHLVRCVSGWGEKKISEPRNRPLRLLFMACSARDVRPELDFEKEEETIFHITGKLAVDMEVEDSGSLEGLGAQLQPDTFDVVHLSGHADIDKQGRPFFIMEDETGARRDVYAQELWQEALTNNPPRLLFLSGCRTGEAPKSNSEKSDSGGADKATLSFARHLVEDFHLPAVIGWGRSVSDMQATHAESVLYRELSRGQTILQAVQRARCELNRQFAASPHPAWPLLRLFCGGEPPAAIVKTGQKRKIQPRRLVHTYLKKSRVKILTEGFVGRRRQLQQGLRALKTNFDKIGLLLHGSGGLGKSCLAGRISERFSDHTLIIVHGRLDAVTLETALRDAFIIAGDDTGAEILKEKSELIERLARLCTSSFKERHYLLLFDDFEQNMEGAGQGRPGPLLPGAAELMSVLLHYLPFSGKSSQLLITSRYTFSLDEQGRNIVKECLEFVPLTGFKEAEQQKKSRELRSIVNYPDPDMALVLLTAGHGNPRLMEWLDVLAGQMGSADIPQLAAAIKDKQEEFIREHVIRELLRCGGEELSQFLRRFSLYRLPVHLTGVEKMALPGDWQSLLERGIGLSLIEFDRAQQAYQVTPLLHEELLNDLKDPELFACHQAAFAYYKKTCETAKAFDPIEVEECIFHALRCGQEETASRQGGRLVTHLRNRLAFRESLRVGHWVLSEKKETLSTTDDAFLLNELAGVIKDLGNYKKAIEYYEQALKIDRAVYGNEHPDVAIDLNNLGAAWDNLGDYKKAIDYFEQALKIIRKTYGENHPHVAGSLNNLGGAWQALGEPKKAIDYYEQAQKIDRAVYGNEHPDVAIDLNNLGAAWDNLGEFKKAIDYFEQALKIDRAVYGDEHPNVAIGLNNIGSIYL